MPTKSELRKLSKAKGFTKNLEEFGFKLGPSGLWFYRERDNLIDFMEFWITSSKNWASFPVICYIREQVEHCDMTNFPKGFQNGVSSLTNLWATKNGLGYSDERWKIDEDNLDDTFVQLVRVIQYEVNPWFLNLTSEEEVLETYG